jgi:hypothetical protein
LLVVDCGGFSVVRVRLVVCRVGVVAGRGVANGGCWLF